ncbi:hypothetical protein GKZ68_04755 [Hymenobacter sp. BRD128]|uniref:hypothetical protein n=1 Tax=Hymenobacter sp. BRD128 TaxID=2675878 RepID=UPI001562F326|nr:hypothetical protein [Hymenobacter sp. BRD128]QKG56009.1 hypothetical protein GKZ68_04755 [Hymenobacter sp. BRD128]
MRCLFLYIKKTIYCIILLACLATSARAQQPASPAPTAAELKKNFATIEAGTEGESDDFDKLTTTTARRLVTYLKAHEVSAAGAKDLGVELSAESADASHLKVFTYSLSSGGTRGTIHKPVLQWQNAAGQHFAYAVDEECEFTEIHPLASPGRALYLLLGMEKGDGQCDVSQAYVVELKGNYLLADNAVFGKKSSLSLCNVDMQLDASRQVLRINQTRNKEISDDALRLKERDYRRKPGAKSLVLKLSGGRFVQSQ